MTTVNKFSSLLFIFSLFFTQIAVHKCKWEPSNWYYYIANALLVSLLFFFSMWNKLVVEYFLRRLMINIRFVSSRKFVPNLMVEIKWHSNWSTGKTLHEKMNRKKTRRKLARNRKKTKQKAKWFFIWLVSHSIDSIQYAQRHFLRLSFTFTARNNDLQALHDNRCLTIEHWMPEGRFCRR